MPLVKTGNASVLVDECDVPLAASPGWYFDGTYFRRHRPGSGKKGATDLLHRMILKAPPRIQDDHKNGNTKDNRRANLRLASMSLQRFNSKVRSDNASGHVGIYEKQYATCFRWLAYGRSNGRTEYLGSFVTLTEAIAARSEWELRVHGEIHRSRATSRRTA